MPPTHDAPRRPLEEAPPNDAPCHAARALRRVALAVLVLAAAALGLSAPARAQTVTLPTVRTFGPGPEEAILFRLIRELRADYGGDVLARPEPPASTALQRTADTVARRLLPRLDQLILAPVTDDQLHALVRDTTRRDSLATLAGTRYVADDPVPQQLFEAIARIVAREETEQGESQCPPAERRSRKSSTRRRADFTPLTAKDLPGVSTEALELRNASLVRANRVRCARNRLSLQQHLPALLLASVRQEAEGIGNARRVAKADSLARVATAVVILRTIDTRRLFPVTNRAQADLFWRQRGLAPLNVGSIAGSGDAGVAFTELASPLLQAVRVSVNAVLAAEEPAAEPATETATGPALAPAAGEAPPSAAVQRLLTGGGLFNVSFAWPVTNVDWHDGDLSVVTLLVPRFGLTAPVLGAVRRDSTTVNMDLGVELHTKAIDLVDGVGVVAQLRGAYARGSGSFAESVGVTDRRHVSYLTTSFGFLFGRQYLVTASHALAGPRAIRRAPWQIGVTVVRAPSPL